MNRSERRNRSEKAQNKRIRGAIDYRGINFTRCHWFLSLDSREQSKFLGLARKTPVANKVKYICRCDWCMNTTKKKLTDKIVRREMDSEL